MAGLKLVWGFNSGVMAGVMLFAPESLNLNEVQIEFILGSSNIAAGIFALLLRYSRTITQPIASCCIHKEEGSHRHVTCLADYTTLECLLKVFNPITVP